EAADHLRAQYAAKVTWMDRCFGRFLEVFYESGLAANTALLLTSDHGTRVGQFGRFGKGGRIQEQISRAPLFIRPPAGQQGRCAEMAQPQDFWPTLAALAGVEAPGLPGAQDLLAVARGERDGARPLALAGGSADGWANRGSAPLFTVFAPDDYLELALRPEDSLLHRYGDTADAPDQPAGRIGELHAAGLDELERRGADQALIRWLRSGGEAELPDDVPLFRGWPKPAGYRPYFQRLYHGE
ncbi:MAG: sulfatase-like hydrolase/transferase, partial [Candidatus Brocadiia bacterium]